MTRCCSLVAIQQLAQTQDSKPILFSAMGEGEPLLNYRSTKRLLVTFLELTDWFGSRDPRFSVSTSGINPSTIAMLRDSKLTRELKLKLQISLHGVNHYHRQRLIPHVADFERLVHVGKSFQDKYPQQLEWNYVLIAGINDTDRHARDLAAILGPGAYVKLNRYNPISLQPFEPSPRGEKFQALLRHHGVIVEHYATDGTDVGAACGQLRHQLFNPPRETVA
jgi:23S rRNA (adenine2503-C2)-methyltransferase